MAHRIPGTTTLLSVLAFACGGSGGGGGGGGQPAAGNVIASAGRDFDVAATALVYLDAGASYEKTGALLTYAWTQTGGPPVVLTGSGTATPSFVAPSPGGDLAFSVSVSNGTETAVDSLAV
ncbi:MAG TPA: serine protease, partial [Planctomycetota bacterium]|nr:serine protease [Planctomycetota bacterium]